MDYLEIKKSTKLKGEIVISGAKNSALPIIASTLLSKEPVTITNVPEVKDILTLLTLIENLGGKYKLKNGTLKIDNSNINSTKAMYDIVKTMRASILVLAPLLVRFKHCEISMPGGCAIGQRPIDLHLKALQELGANVKIKSGYVDVETKENLKGCEITFDKITVGGTENLLMAAALAEGITTLNNCALEPEIIQLCEFIKSAGVKITGIGTKTIHITGTNGKLLKFKKCKIIPDRLEVGTYLCVGAITKSNIKLKKIEPKHLEAVTSKLREIGVELKTTKNSIEITKVNKLKPFNITTLEYPGFPTDLQAQFLALATQIEGSSVIEEKIFENRFMYVAELKRMGASINLSGHTATVEKSNLEGTTVMATDLRAGAALIIASLVAKGTTKIERIYHLDRGYERLEFKLKQLGCNITRKSDNN